MVQRKSEKYKWKDRDAHFRRLEFARLRRAIFSNKLRDQALNPSIFAGLSSITLSDSAQQEGITRSEREGGTTIPPLNTVKMEPGKDYGVQIAQYPD
uniref:Uncharacterized protein n=1 Tax=viral metagenome TaxID=1070528 RepID=A0A6M3L8C0_9ZZZZ